MLLLDIKDEDEGKGNKENKNRIENEYFSPWICITIKLIYNLNINYLTLVYVECWN
jgi:hypothetical protein